MLRDTPKWGSRDCLHVGFTTAIPLTKLTAVQRLYSMFPFGGPGLGLVLLRLALVLALWVERHAVLEALPESLAPACLIVIVIALVLGGLTSLFTSLAMLISGLGMLHASTFTIWLGALTLLMGTALLMLGPGAYSIDARLYGRRRVTLHREKD
jgi:asparagine N-glycosylation enzyme membrane subunit Stt3